MFHESLYISNYSTFMKCYYHELYFAHILNWLYYYVKELIFINYG